MTKLTKSRRKITPGLTVRGKKVTQFDIMDKAVVAWQAHQFVYELEKRSMSTWSEEELARYSELTGQDKDIVCGCGDPNCREDMAPS